MKVIGITGGIGSGKSRILDYMEEKYSARILKTDLAARKLQEPGNICYKRIVDVFGKEILYEDGRIDRKKLGNLVFADTRKLKMLNEIVHPEVKAYVREELRKAEREGVALFLIESALLMEDHYEEFCEELWYIFVNREVRVQRLKDSRMLSEGKIRQIMDSQADEASYRSYCNVVIDNSGTFAETEEQIEKVIKRT